MAVVLATNLGLMGCIGADAAGSMCERGVGVTSAPLFGAAERPELLELDEREQNAVVALVMGDSTVSLCTGVLLAPTVVMTAAHCVAGWAQMPEVRLGPDAGDPEWAVVAQRMTTHPTLDLALFDLPQPVPGDLAIPLQFVRARTDLVDARVQMAGYGLAEDNTFGARLFADEVVVEQSDDLVTVDGAGERGACLGDSGGPLLVADGLSQVRVLGILSRGSASCLGIDQYVLVHRAVEWLDDLLEAACPR